MNDLLLPAEKLAPTQARYLVLLWLCGSAAVAYTQRGCIGVAEKDIRDALCLTEPEMGLAMSAFFFSYALGQLPTGWLGHLWGTRRALPVYCLISSAATGLLSLAGGLPGLVLGRFSMGIGQAGFFPCATDTLAKWFPLRRRSFATGVLGAFMSLGGALGAGLTGLVLIYLDWRWLFVLLALPGVLWSLEFYLWFRDRPREHAAVNAAERILIEGGQGPTAAVSVAAPPEPTPWLRLLVSRKMWWISGQQFCRAAGQQFFFTWFTTYLKATHPDVGKAEAGWMTTLPLAGVALGGILGGWLSDRLLAASGSRRLSRQGLSLASQLACTAFVAIAYFVPTAWPAVLLFSAGWLIGGFASPCAYAITIDMGGRHVPTVFAMMNMAGNLGAMVLPVAVPWVREYVGWNTAVLLLMAGLPLAAAVFWALLDPDGTVFD